MELLQRWFNFPPSSDAAFITNKRGEKFWIYWENGSRHANLHVSYHGRPVGKVNLAFIEPGEAIIADIIIFRIRRKDAKLRGCGLGKAMLREAMKFVESRGNVKSVWGWIEPDEHTTIDYLIDWYRKQGFSVFKEEDKYFIEKSL